MLQVMGLVLVFTHKFGKKKESRSYCSFHYQIIIPVASYTFGWAGRVSQSPLPVPPANPSCCVGGSKWLWSKGSPAWIHREIKWIYSSLYQDISEEGFVLLIEWASPFVPRQFLSTQATSLNFFCLKCSCWALDAAAFRVHVLPVPGSVAELFVSWAETNGGGSVQRHTAGYVCGRAGHSGLLRDLLGLDAL